LGTRNPLGNPNDRRFFVGAHTVAAAFERGGALAPWSLFDDAQGKRRGRDLSHATTTTDTPLAIYVSTAFQGVIRKSVGYRNSDLNLNRERLLPNRKMPPEPNTPLY